MGNALAGVWDAALHDHIMSELADRRDARAAGCYAFALREFVKQVPPLLDLAHLIIDWQGDTEVARGFLHYALIVGLVAALDAHDHDLVRRAHDAASWIGEPPLEPEAYARGRTWQNPLDDEAVQAKLARALAGAPEVAATAEPPPASATPKKKARAARTKKTSKPKPKAAARKRPTKAKQAAKPKAKQTATPKVKKAAKPKPKQTAKPKAAKPARKTKPKAKPGTAKAKPKRTK
jgi:outer membrane biosynthesis protein TonB